MDIKLSDFEHYFNWGLSNMCEVRFFKKEYPYDWWFIFDREQEYLEDMKIPFETEHGNLIAMSEDQVVDLLNKLYNENEDNKCLLGIYVDFMVSEGYELSDVVEFDRNR